MKDDLRDYIVRQLRRTNKKDFESYCINRIYHLLGRDDVQFITQQMFRRDNKKIALADLYLPQINLIVEIDEGHHSNQEDADKKRTEEIIERKKNRFEESIEFNNKPERIDVTQRLSDINLKIEKIIKEIKRRLSELENKGDFVSWNASYKLPEEYIKDGVLNAKDKPAFRYIQEVSELFGKGYGGKNGGKTQRSYFADKDGSKKRIWCPKLKINGEKYNVKWNNEITGDGKFIYESDDKNNMDYRSKIKKYNEGFTTRYVFAYFRDSTGAHMYRFRGVFELDPQETEKKKVAVWNRVGDKINLKEYFKEAMNE